jgi:F-type H+-transporting ATPase subunit b
MRAPFTTQWADAASHVPTGLFLASILLFAGFLVAQEHPADPQGEHASASAQSQAGAVNPEPAKASHEAGGEEKDETAEFKESASVRLLARTLRLSLKQAYWLSIVINFAVIAGLIVWFSRSKLPGMFRARTESIQKAMAEARQASEEARARLAQVEARLARLSDEIAQMRSVADKEAAAEEARIKAAAAEDARKIVESAEQEIAAAAKSARRELTAYAADLAVSLAQKQIRVDAATDQNLVRKFTGKLSENGGKEQG